MRVEASSESFCAALFAVAAILSTSAFSLLAFFACKLLYCLPLLFNERGRQALVIQCSNVVLRASHREVPYVQVLQLCFAHPCFVSTSLATEKQIGVIVVAPDVHELAEPVGVPCLPGSTLQHLLVHTEIKGDQI